MNLDEIQALWDEDSKIDQDELHVESTKFHPYMQNIIKFIII